MKNSKKYFMITLIVILTVCLISLVTIYIVKKTRTTGIKSPDIYIEKTVEESNRKNKTSFKDDVVKISNKYPEAKAWIKIPGTKIDYPIFQTTDNEKYISLDRDGNKYKWGEIFLDYRSDITDLKSKEIKNSIIYGHNTTRDSYFTELTKYKDASFFEKNNIIYLSTKDKDYKLKIISAYETDTNFYYIDTNFKNSDEYAQFLYKIETKSINPSDISLIGDEGIVTLSTCIEGNENKRFAVHAIIID